MKSMMTMMMMPRVSERRKEQSLRFARQKQALFLGSQTGLLDPSFMHGDGELEYFIEKYLNITSSMFVLVPFVK